MDSSDQRQRSLTRSRHGKDFHYNSSLDAEDCCVPTQKSYSSSETLKAYDHDSRLHYAGCVADLVHCDADEFTRQRNFTLAELGLCEAAATAHPSLYCSDLGPAARGYSPSVGSDADSDPEEAMSPERAVDLWAGRAGKSGRSSGPSSRENSALTLTDSDNEDKSDDGSGRRCWLEEK
ncbi:teneurin-2 [Brienomyrus brachyistius]|uniref:teneurin-2 n=1 Tax=Brienomyrus brachyistius TaxID=42636 RepID=UPI0020B3D42C|nr:teneurin-2 [Brienomyrus brachyistius]